MRLRCLSLLLVAIALVRPPAGHAQRINLMERPLQSEPSRQFDAIHYKITIDLDDSHHSFLGETTVTLVPFNDGFDSCRLDAGTYTVSKVIDGMGRKLTFTQGSDHLLVRLPVSYRSGDTVRLVVSYHAERLNDTTGQAPGINFMKGSPAHPPQIFTQSFPRGARHWFPCYDQPNDKATQEVIATVRSDYELLSNGRLINVTEKVGRKTFHWSLERPHSTYLSTIIAAPFVITRDSLGTLPVNYWVYPRDRAKTSVTFGRTPELIAFFNREYGFPYPWEKYDQATIAGVGGGAECTSASELGDGMMHDERAEQDFSSYGWLICHELAHQWWGDLVTCRDWTHTWINETFGTYSEVMYALYDKGEDAAAVNVAGKVNQYLQEAHSRYVRPIVFSRWDNPGDNFDRHTYQKGAVLVHMMRWLLGEKPFHKLLAHFLKSHAFRPADTHDFMTAVKEATGENLDWFFEDWFFKPGHPVFDVHYRWDEQRRKLVLSIVQSQDTSQGVPIFRAPVVIGVLTEGGSTSERVFLRKREESVEIPCALRPLMVRFDQGNHLLKELIFQKTTDELLYQARHDDVVGRMWAIGELATSVGEVRVRSALMNIAQKDSFWAVRRDAVYRLGGFRGTVQMDLDRGLIPQSRLDSVQLPEGLDISAMTSFFKSMALDVNSQVRAAALYALGNFGRREEGAFLMDRFAKDDSYVAQASALRALGKCGDGAVSDLLRRALAMESPRNVLHSAAEWSLKRLNAR